MSGAFEWESASWMSCSIIMDPKPMLAAPPRLAIEWI